MKNKTMCEIDGCHNYAARRGLCWTHYNRWKRNGDPLKIIRPEIRHGLRAKPEYMVWARMIDRCYNKNNASYANYGAKGISVCDRWRNPVNFINDMGPRPSGKYPSGVSMFSIDRIDNRLGYSPENCRWANLGVQNHNRQLKKSDGLPHNIRIHKGKRITSYEVAVAGKYIGRFKTLEEAIEAKHRAVKEKYGIQEIDY